MPIMIHPVRWTNGHTGAQSDEPPLNKQMWGLFMLVPNYLSDGLETLCYRTREIFAIIAMPEIYLEISVCTVTVAPYGCLLDSLFL